MIIVLPSQFNLNSFPAVFGPILGLDRAPQCRELVIDFENLLFIEPTGVTILANIVRWLLVRNIPVEFRNHNIDTRGINYLYDSGFFEIFSVIETQHPRTIRSSMKSLEFMTAENGLFWIRSNMLSWLVSNSGRNSASFRELLVCFLEIFQNIRDHAGIDFGSVHAQYFPKTQKLCMSIADIGIGIPDRVRAYLGRNEQDFKDSDCIIKACEYGFTTSNSVGNQGRGLANLTDIVTQHYNGTVVIVSDKGLARYSNRRKALYNTNREWLYPGTLIDIEILVSHIPIVEDEPEEYEW